MVADSFSRFEIDELDVLAAMSARFSQEGLIGHSKTHSISLV
jgi:hypothetical protein